MYQRIDEKIMVAGVYAGRVFQPKRFKWSSKLYEIEEITLVSDVKDGGRKLRLYSVVVKGTVYRLCFDRDSEAWRLEEVWFEG